MNMMMPHLSAESQQTSTRTVLVVDDDALVRMTIVEYLRDCGYTVLEAGDACEAMALIDCDQSIDLVFSDVRMPGPMDGFGLSYWVRRTHPDVQMLLTSGYNALRSMPPDVSRGARLIEKPYSHAQVAQKIDDLLAG